MRERERYSLARALVCSASEAAFPFDRPFRLSPEGAPFLVSYDTAGLAERWRGRAWTRRPVSMWRYHELLPVPDREAVVSLGECRTPLIPLGRLPRQLGFRGTVWIKDDSRLPTGSFKARGLAVAVSMARWFGYRRLALPTNGNAGAALAAYAARAGLEALVVAPSDLPPSFIAEARAFGAEVRVMDGLIDDCGRWLRAHAAELGVCDLSTLREPYRVEGKKTIAFELWEQFRGGAPDVIVYPTGGGTGIIAMWKAFDELAAAGLFQGPPPRLVAVQAEGCAPIVRAFREGAGRASRWPEAATRAVGIRVPATVGDALILRALRETGGCAVAVGEEEIREAQDALARAEGLWLCPEGAACWAGFLRLRDCGWLDGGERVVLFNGATPLKYPLSGSDR